MKNALTTWALPLVLIGAGACKSTSSTSWNSGSTASTATTRSNSGSSSASTTNAAASTRTTRSEKGVTTRLAYPTGDAKTSALLIEKTVPAEVVANQPFTYTMKVTNLTDLTLENVLLTEERNAAFTVSGADPKPTKTSATLSSWSFGNMPAKSSQVITVSGQAKGTETLKSCASISYNTSLCATIPVVKPAIKLMASGPAEVNACDEIVYRYVVENTGSGAARDVQVSANLPNGMTVNGKSTITEAVGTLAAGAKKEFTVKAKAAGIGAYEHSAKAAAEGGLSAASSMLKTTVSNCDLKVAITAPKNSFAGRDLTYDITVTNGGNGIAQNAVIEAAVPRGATFKSASDKGKTSAGTVRWNLGEMAPNATKKLTMRVSTEEFGNLVGRVTAKATCCPDVTASTQTAVKGIPAILLEVIDLEDPIPVGDDVTYVIKVTNQGSAADTNVKIVVTLPENVSYVTSTGGTTANVNGRTVNFAPVTRLEAKDEIEWRVTVKGNSPLDARFKTSMTSDQLTSPVEETEATNFYE